MASEVISHAIFASSHPTPPPPAPPCLPLRLPPSPPLTLLFALPPTRHSTLHPTLRSPAPTQHPIMPFTLRPDPIPHRSFPSHFFAPHDSLSQVTPSKSLHLPPVHPFPIRMSLHPPCSSAKSRLWIFSCVKRPGSLTT